MKSNWKLMVMVVVIAAGAIGLSLNSWTRGHVVEVWKQFAQTGSHGEESAPDKSWVRESVAKSKVPWDQLLTLDAHQIQAIGLKTVAVRQQTDPTLLRLSGTTDYDPATVTVVRTQFDSRVDKVLVDLGTPVKIGDPLLDLFSNDLAEAKSNYELASSQWAHDKKVLDYKTPLAQDNTLPRKELIEVENDEAQSRLKMKLAKDKLLVYGLTEKEIENAKTEDGVEKAKMILRSRAVGVVVLRNVVQGNYYSFRGPLDDDRASGSSLGPGQRQRARRRKSRSRPELESDLPVLRSNDRRQGRLHRQGDRFRFAIRQVPLFHSAIPRDGSKPGCSCAYCWSCHRSRDGPSFPAPPWSRLTGSTTSSSKNQGRWISLSDVRFSCRSKKTTW